MNNVLTPEELQEMIDDNPGFQAHIQKCLDLGVDPIKGIAFIKEFMTTVNTKKLELERKYKIQTDIQCMVLIIAKHKDKQPMLESKDSTLDNKGS